MNVYIQGGAHMTAALLALFIAVHAHEFGHVWMAKKRGLQPVKSWRTGWQRYSPFVLGVVTWLGGTDEDERKILAAGLAFGAVPLLFFTTLLDIISPLSITWTWVAYVWVCRKDLARYGELHGELI